MTDVEQKPKTDNWAEMSDGVEDEPEVEENKSEQEPEEEVEKIVIPPTMKGSKNKGGDYVVTSIDIPDLREGVKSKSEQLAEETDSDEGYGDEDEPKEEAKAEVAKEGKSYFIFLSIFPNFGHFEYYLFAVLMFENGQNTKEYKYLVPIY